MVGKNGTRKLQRNSMISLCTDCRLSWVASNEALSPSQGRFCTVCVAKLKEYHRPVWSRLMDRAASVRRVFTCCVCRSGGKKQHYWTTDEKLAEHVRKKLGG